jgi:hypothetical protein
MGFVPHDVLAFQMNALHVAAALTRVQHHEYQRKQRQRALKAEAATNAVERAMSARPQTQPGEETFPRSGDTSSPHKHANGRYKAQQGARDQSTQWNHKKR